jgi:DNA polymerase elongation subunit (family B)
MRVLCWVATDAHGNEYAGLLDEDSDQDEARVLSELWGVIEHYDQVLAWNGDRFDFPVIKARSERYNLLRPAVREWRRWLWLDYLDLFKRFNMQVAESGDEKQSFKLGVVAESVLGKGEGKLEFDASKTWEEWAAGGDRRQRVLDYCAQDTRLMPEIEAKTGYIMLLGALSETCGTFPDTRGTQPGVQVEGFLARLALERGYKHPTVLNLSTSEAQRYDGAYVLHPEKKAGIHRDVHVADFAGLYPSIIRTWNMSPETIVEEPAGYPTAYSPLTKKHFRTDIAGILPEAVKRLMDQRAVWNKKKASLPPGTEEWKDADRRAGAYKIATNSFYGVIGSPTARFYDRDVAESVTQCGKWLIIETIKAAEQRGMKVIYGDTDSLFVVGSTRQEFESFVRWANEELYPRILEEVGCVDNVISLAYEKQFDRLVMTTAKRYAGSYVHYKGKLATSDSHPEIKGLEFKRGDALKIARSLQEELAHLIVGYKQPFSDEPSDYVAVIERVRDHILNGRLELGDVLVSKRLNKEIEEYKTPNNAMLRIAKEMEAAGEDVGEGAKIDYVVIDASVSPQRVIRAHEYDPDSSDLNREALWDKLIWPPSQRLMEAAFPGFDWSRIGGLVKGRKAAARAAVKAARDLEKAQAKAAKSASRVQGRKPLLNSEMKDGDLFASSARTELPTKKRIRNSSQ